MTNERTNHVYCGRISQGRQAMSVLDKILAEIEDKKMSTDGSQRIEAFVGADANNAALAEAKSIVTKHLNAITVDEVAIVMREKFCAKEGCSVDMYDLAEFTAEAQAILQLIRGKV